MELQNVNLKSTWTPDTAYVFSTLSTGASAGPDSCQVVNQATNCEGDQSDGVVELRFFDPLSLNVFNIQNLTSAIKPTALFGGVPVHGVEIRSLTNGPLTVNVDTSGLGIDTGSDLYSDGIIVSTNNFGNPGDLILNNISTPILSGQNGIHTYVPGDSDNTVVNTDSPIDAIQFGIWSTIGGNGNLTITNTNSALTTGHVAIHSRIGGVGTLTVANEDSDIVSGASGIAAETSSGAVVIVNGNSSIDAHSGGIQAQVLSGGTIDVSNTNSTILAGSIGIIGSVFGNGDVTVANTESTITANSGIVGYAIGGGDIKITNTRSAILARSGTGIESLAFGDGTSEITNIDSTIDATTGSGLSAEISGNGSIVIDNVNSAINAHQAGIVASAGMSGGMGAVTITNTDSAIVSGENGLSASVRGNGDIKITNTNSQITSGKFGIQGTISGDGNVSIANINSPISSARMGIYSQVTGTGSITIDNYSSIDAVEQGIYVLRYNGGAPALINNHARITSNIGAGFAIDLRGDAPDVVNLFADSVIEGKIDFGNGNGGTNPDDIDTLNIANGVNAQITFADASGQDSDLESAPELITLGQIGSVVGGNGTGVTVVSADISGFKTHAPQAHFITKTTLNIVDHAPEAPEADVSAHGGGGEETQGRPAYSLWASGMGGYIRYDESDNHPFPIEHKFSGTTAGMEVNPMDIQGRFGLFAGYVRSLVSGVWGPR